MGPEDEALSALQLGPWLQHRIDASDPRYHTGMPFRVRGALDRAAVERWWRGAIARHDAMRITFGERGGVPYQRVAAAREATVIEHDVRGWDEARVYERIVALHKRPFRLEVESPYELHVLSRGDTDQTILMRSHHIVVDLGAEDALFAELRDTLAGAALAPPGRPYLDFVRAHRERLAGPDGERLARFWQDALAGAPTTVDLPVDRQRTARAGTRGASHAFHLLDAAKTRLLRAHCERTRTSMFRVLFAAYLAFLHRHTGQDDVLVAVPADCRGRDFDGSVGNFVNVMALRGRVDPKESFLALVERSSAVVRAAAAHRDYPFPAVVERLRPPREPGRAPLVQTSFNVTQLRRCPELEGILWPVRGSAWRGALPGLEVDSEPPIPAQEGHFELGLTIAERRDHLDAELKYDPDLFEPATIARFADRLRALLDGVLADPTRAVADLPRMTERERELVTVTWPAEPEPFTPRACHAAFEEQARRHPDAPAVAQGRDVLTYVALDARANRLAHALRRLGVTTETLVGIHLPRSIDVVVTMLAALKAGGAFLPLDDAYPPDRVAFMIEDAKPLCVVTTSELAARLPEGARTLLLDAEAGAIEREPATPPPCDAAPSSLAYVIYTSGSTGRPKGVLIEHRGVCNLAEALARVWKLGPGDRLYCFASFSFDAAIADVFPSLGAGALVHLGPRREPLAGAELHAFMREERITHVTLTPAVWATLPLEPLPALRVAVSAGEACALETVATWGAGRTFFNNYGPTEITVCATVGLCQRPEDALSIGRPMANTRAYVLDDAGEPTPIGVPGELCLGGVGVARGYHARPELTTARFVVDPFAPGERIYKTGDLARWRADGKLEYLGRRDTQVKLRGQRLELGEIEAAVRAHDDVADACVVVHGPSERRVLVAYVTRSGATDPDAGAIKKALAAALPEFMVPAQIVAVDALPLTVNGKVDRKALAARPLPQADVARGDPPRPGVEEAIAAIWSRVLRLDAPLGRDDDFYAVGGDSLAALVVAHEVGCLLGRAVPPSLLPTSRTLAAFCEALEKAPTEGDVLPLRARPDGGRAVFFLPGAGGDVSGYVALAERLPAGLCPLGLRADVEGSIAAMAAAHAATILREQPAGTIDLVGWSLGGVVAVRVARDLEAAGRTVRVALVDARLPRASGPSRIPAFLRVATDLGPAAAALAALAPEELEAVGARLEALAPPARAAAALEIARERGLSAGDAGLAASAISAALAARARRDVLALEAHDPDFVAADMLAVTARRSRDAGATTPWSRFTSGRFEESLVDADHHGVLREPAVAALADLLARWLA